MGKKTRQSLDSMLMKLEGKIPTSPSSLFLSVPPAGPYCLCITSLFYRERASFCSLPSQNFRSSFCLSPSCPSFSSLNSPYHPSSLENCRNLTLKWGFTGLLWVKTPPFQCRGHGFDPWAGKFCMLCGAAQTNKQTKQGLVTFCKGSK